VLRRGHARRLDRFHRVARGDHRRVVDGYRRTEVEVSGKGREGLVEGKVVLESAKVKDRHSWAGWGSGVEVGEDIDLEEGERRSLDAGEEE